MTGKGRISESTFHPIVLLVWSKPEFTFLAHEAKSDGHYRVKAKKLRGVISFGLLVPAPIGFNVGDDVAEHLGVEHYEPPIAGTTDAMVGGDVASPPKVCAVKYDLDSFRRYCSVFRDGEMVVITEKLDGANARYVYHDGEMHCGSRTEWKKQFTSYDHVTVESLTSKGVSSDRIPEILEKLKSRSKQKSMWWELLERTPSLEKFCRDHPDVVVYGEIYGSVNQIKYGIGANRFAAFDVLDHGQWLNYSEARNCVGDVPWVPVLSKNVPYSFDLVCSLAEGFTTVEGAATGVIREGCVVRPVAERRNNVIGRVCLKCVSGAYLEKHR